jgi:ribonuclease J
MPRENKLKRVFGGKKPQSGKNPIFNKRKESKPAPRHRFSSSKEHPNQRKEKNVLPPLKDGDIRIINFGGVEEVGRNMSMVEYKDEIIVIDAGFQFESEDDVPGVDYMLPNTKYLEENKDKIKCVIITHGHLDHIGGIPYILPRIGNPTIYARELTLWMIKRRQEEYPESAELDIKTINVDDKIKFNHLSMEFFPVTHSVPEAIGLKIKTPYGNIITTGDVRLEHENGEPAERERKTYSDLGKEKNLLLMIDSTGIEQPGFSIAEPQIFKTLEEIIKESKCRLIIGTFASQIARLIKIIEIAEKYNKKIVTEGRSIKTNIDIAISAGLCKPKKGTIISSKDMTDYPPDRILILATGAQGEEFAALMRMASGKHKNITLTGEDTVVLSSSVIPGNDLAVRKLKDNLYRHNIKLIHYRVSDVHSSGHGNRGELVWITEQIKPKYFMPTHGFHSMLKIHAEVAESIGIPRKNIIVPDNGQVIEIQNEGNKIEVLKKKVPSSPLMVDGVSVGDIQEAVMKDRQLLAKEGIFTVIVILDPRTGKLKKSPDIISRGFVYLRESQNLLNQTRLIIKKSIEDSTRGNNPVNFDYVRSNLTTNVRRFLYQQTAKTPIVIPVIVAI